MGSDDTWPLEAWFRLGVIHLHIAPRDFWNMALRDWLWLTRKQKTAMISNERLVDLMTQFPDEED